LALGWLSGLASGQNLIREWTGASGYRIFETTVWIDAPGTYKFQATDPNGPNGLAVIDHILLDANCPEGTVNVYVLRDPNEGGGYGAKGVGEINLKKTGVETNIMDVLTTVNLAYLDMIQADTISGDIGTPDIGNDITVDYLGANIMCDHMHSLEVLHGTSGTFPPSITVSGDWGDEGADLIHVEDGPLGLLVVGGCMSGTIKVADADGIVISVVAGDLKAANAYELVVYSCPGSITIAGSVTYADLAELSGALRCGTLAGILTVTDSPLSGSITIDHDLDGLYGPSRDYPATWPLVVTLTADFSSGRPHRAT
jgi:hypothetical protein